MTILVDMDDVLELMLEGWVQVLNARYGTNATPDDVTSWQVEDAFPGLTKEQVYSVELEDSFWDWVQPMPGAREALEKLISEGHEIYVVTATAYQTLRAKMEKVLFRYFPFIDWKHVIVTFNKQMIEGDILIDDGPHNLQGGTYEKILFHSYHNHNFDESSVGAVRAYNWEEVYNYVQDICRRKAGNKS